MVGSFVGMPAQRCLRPGKKKLKSLQTVTQLPPHEPTWHEHSQPFSCAKCFIFLQECLSSGWGLRLVLWWAGKVKWPVSGGLHLGGNTSLTGFSPVKEMNWQEYISVKGGKSLLVSLAIYPSSRNEGTLFLVFERSCFGDLSVTKVPVWLPECPEAPFHLRFRSLGLRCVGVVHRTRCWQCKNELIVPINCSRSLLHATLWLPLQPPASVCVWERERKSCVCVCVCVCVLDLRAATV